MKSILLAVAVGTIWTWLGPPAAGQSALDKLEEMIRRQRAEAAAEPDVPAPPVPADGPALDRPPAEAPKPDRGYLGLVADDRETVGRGIEILKVFPDGPAEKAGLKAGDLITALGGVRVRAMEDAAAVLEQVPPDGKLRFEVLRGGQRLEMDVTFGRPPAVSPDVPEAPPTEEAPPTGPAAGEGASSAAERIRQLEQRIAELEARVHRLERAILEAK